MASTAGQRAGVDFFVSYASADVAWAEWIAWQLVDAGHSTRIEAWDAGPGSRFVAQMRRAAAESTRTVAVLSARYLRSTFAEVEWPAGWLGAADERQPLVFRVEDCDRPGPLREVTSVDLFGVDRRRARDLVRAAAQSGRPEPSQEPDFPGWSEPAFPGAGRGSPGGPPADSDGPSIFLNYRNADGEGWAVFLDYRLRTEFGRDAVFRASRSIPPADDFVRRLLAAVRTCSVLLALIGPSWLAAADRDGRRRLDDEQDWVRRELAEAFRHGIPVLPVLLGNAQPVSGEHLPAEIAQLANCQYVRLGHRSDEADIARIVDALRRLAPGLGWAEPGDHQYRPRPGHRTGPGGPLTAAERNELVAAFGAVERLWDRGRRQDYVTRAESRYGRQLPYPHRTVDHDDIEGLVKAWLDQPGALHELVAVLTADAPGSPEVAALRRALNTAVPAPALIGEERRKLDRAVSGIDQLTAIRAFHRAFGISPPPMRHDLTDPHTIVADLEEVAAAPEEVPPLLWYLEHLASARGAHLDAIALREIVDEIGARLRAPTEPINELRREILGRTS